MAANIERLLRLAADYQNFCDELSSDAAQKNSDELSEEELFLVAAAAGRPADPADGDSEKH